MDTFDFGLPKGDVIVVTRPMANIDVVPEIKAGHFMLKNVGLCGGRIHGCPGHW